MWAADANAVRLDPEAGGQALIFPYYTVRSYGTDPFNTYLSIVNTSADGKALRVRFREGRQGLETLGFNLFLSPNDTWTGALVPSADGGTLLVTSDNSCVSPAMSSGNGVHSQALSAAAFATDGVDRTREGYVEVFEMGTVTGATLTAITQGANGVPHDCSVVQKTVTASDIAAPTGGLQGTLTLINVASGMDATVNADALASLASRPYYRDPADAYPDWNIAEIDPVSYVTTSTHAYRLAWANGLQAVDSVLMRTGLSNEFILDPGTASSTDWVVTMPTRRLHLSATSATAPFSAASGTLDAGCEAFASPRFDREANTSNGHWCTSYNFDDCPVPVSDPGLCASATVIGWRRTRSTAGSVFGSTNVVRSSHVYSESVSAALYEDLNYFLNGAIRLQFSSSGPRAGLASLATSSRMELRSGAFETGAFQVQGLPVMGFMARTFVNGTLSCAATKCQGSYASAFAHQGVVTIGTVP
jgi:hypothetical protein